MAAEDRDTKPSTNPSTVNLVVDVQFGTDPAFIERVRHSADLLKAKGIPTIWITMDNRSELFPPTDTWPSNSAQTRDAAQLEAGGFFGHAPGTSEDKLRAFREHFAKYGPRTDEAMFPKAFFNAFADRTDLSREDMRAFFASQRQPQHAIDIDQAFRGQSLSEYLKGVQHVTIMGGNADVCVTETACGAAKLGIQATIISDHIVSRNDEGGNKPAAQYAEELKALHERMLNSPQELAADKNHPTKAGYASGTIFSDADKAAVRNNVHIDTFENFVSSITPDAIHLPMPILRSDLPNLETLTINDLAKSKPVEHVGWVEDRAGFSASLGWPPDATREYFFIKAPGTGFYIPPAYSQFVPAISQMIDSFYSKYKDDGYCYIGVGQSIPPYNPNDLRPYVHAHKDFISTKNEVTGERVFLNHTTFIVSDHLPTGYANTEITGYDKKRLIAADDPDKILVDVLNRHDVEYKGSEPYEIMATDSHTPHAFTNPTSDMGKPRTILLGIFAGPRFQSKGSYTNNPWLDAAIKKQAANIPAIPPAGARGLGGGVGLAMSALGIYHTLNNQGLQTDPQKFERDMSIVSGVTGTTDSAITIAETVAPKSLNALKAIAPIVSKASVVTAVAVGMAGVMEGAAEHNQTKIISSIGSTAAAFAGAQAGAIFGASIAGPYGAVIGGAAGGIAGAMGVDLMLNTKLRPIELTEQQKAFFAFVDSLPAKPDATMGPELRKLVEAKTNIAQAQTVYDDATNSMPPKDPIGARKALETAENKFTDTFDTMQKDGSIQNAVMELTVRNHPELVASALITPTIRRDSRPPLRIAELTPQGKAPSATTLTPLTPQLF